MESREREIVENDINEKLRIIAVVTRLLQENETMDSEQRKIMLQALAIEALKMLTDEEVEGMRNYAPDWFNYYCSFVEPRKILMRDEIVSS